MNIEKNASLIHTDVDWQERCQRTKSPIQGKEGGNLKRLNVAYEMKCLFLFVPKVRIIEYGCPIRHTYSLIDKIHINCKYFLDNSVPPNDYMTME